MISGDDTRGVAPGWHSPRGWRDDVAVFSSGENCQRTIHEITSSQLLSIITFAQQPFPIPFADGRNRLLHTAERRTKFFPQNLQTYPSYPVPHKVKDTR
jgi:hypothetical protein